MLSILLILKNLKIKGYLARLHYLCKLKHSKSLQNYLELKKCFIKFENFIYII